VAQIVTGVVIGIVAAVWLKSLLVGVLTEIGRVDPRVLVASAALILGAALVACLVPALRAARLDPAVALRND
jgi:ABC-type lipoprotein release transport system permease subunit